MLFRADETARVQHAGNRPEQIRFKRPDNDKNAMNDIATQGLAEKLRTSFAAGEFVKDGRVIAERELAEQLDVGRRALRKALDQLESDGLIWRRQVRAPLSAPRQHRAFANSKDWPPEQARLKSWKSARRSSHPWPGLPPCVHHSPISTPCAPWSKTPPKPKIRANMKMGRGLSSETGRKCPQHPVSGGVRSRQCRPPRSRMGAYARKQPFRPPDQ